MKFQPAHPTIHQNLVWGVFRFFLSHTASPPFILYFLLLKYSVYKVKTYFFFGRFCTSKEVSKILKNTPQAPSY